jgi:hypothetical protein
VPTACLSWMGAWHKHLYNAPDQTSAAFAQPTASLPLHSGDQDERRIAPCARTTGPTMPTRQTLDLR